MKTVAQLSILAAVLSWGNYGAQAFLAPLPRHQVSTSSLWASNTDTVGARHGEDACFLPLKQLDQDYYAPRIIQVRTK